MKTREEQLDEYMDACHKFAIKEAIIRVKFEIKIQKKIFNEDLDYNYFKKYFNDYRNGHIFSDEEWEFVIKSALGINELPLRTNKCLCARKEDYV